MSAKMRAADVKWGFNFFSPLQNLFNVFVSRVTKAIAKFVLIMVIKMILIMFDDRCMKPM